jgi:ABC-type Fe3+-hydroxamate transport system substrate-binding protein
VAKAPPSGPFYPGHDKWNYEYSILQLKPDLIADNWDKLADFMRDKSDYQKLENGIYVRNDSTLLDVIGLSKPIR